MRSFFAYQLFLLGPLFFISNGPGAASFNEDEKRSNRSGVYHQEESEEEFKSPSLETVPTLRDSLPYSEQSTRIVRIPVQDRTHEIIDHLHKEYAVLKERRQSFIENLIPKSLSRTSFNSLATQPFIDIGGRRYKIFGMDDKMPEAQAASIRTQFKESLPSAKALYTNARHVLSLKTVSLVCKSNEEIFLAASYCCPTSPIAARKDKLTLNVSVSLSEIERARVVHLQTQEASILRLCRKLTQSPSDVFDLPSYEASDQRMGHFMKSAQEWQMKYESLLAIREGFSFFKHVIKEGERKYFAFAKNLVEFRIYLQEATLKISTLTQEEKFQEEVRSFLSNCNRYYGGLWEFSSWAQGIKINNPGLEAMYKQWLENTPL